MSPHPQPPCHCENYDRSCCKPNLQATPLGHSLFTQLSEFLIARSAGTEVIQPWVDLRESQLVRRDASQHLRARASNSVGVRELARQTPLQRIQDALLIFTEFVSFAQNLPTLSRIVARYRNAKFIAARTEATCPP